MNNDPPISSKASVVRATLLRDWLKSAPGGGQSKFPITRLLEVDGARTGVIRPLSETIFLHHNDPAIAKKKLAHLGFPRLSETVDRRPKPHNTRMGNFGEVIASEFLRQLRGYQIPIYRLRYNSNDDSSPKGDDVLAFEFADQLSGKKDTVIVAEVKVRSQFKSDAVEEAHDALKKGFRPRPKSFPFVIDMLYRESRDDEAERLLNLLNKFGKKSLKRRSCLFLVTSNEPTEPFACLTGKQLAPGLEAVQLTLTELTPLVNELFDAEVDLDAL